VSDDLLLDALDGRLDADAESALARRLLEEPALAARLLEFARDEALLFELRVPIKKPRSFFWGVLTMAAALLISAVVFWNIVPQEVPDEAAPHVRALGSEDYDTREAAHTELVAMGEKARPALESAVKSPDREVQARAAAILARLDRGRKLDDLSRRIELLPADATLYHARARLLLELGERDRALADADRALALDPGSADAYLLRGSVRRDLDAAMMDFTRAIELEPTRSEAYLLRGRVRSGQAAIADFNRALELNPADAAARIDLGAARIAQGEFERAVNDLDAALKLGVSADAYLNRGIARRSLGDVDGAVKDFQEALKVAPAQWEKADAAKEAIRKP
jgi:tetratricopeptide (TPR) repeat protein